MQLQVEVTFGLGAKNPREGMEKCEGVLLFDYTGMPFIAIDTTSDQISVRTNSELEGYDAAKDFLLRIRHLFMLTIQNHMNMVQLKATLNQAILASNSLQPLEGTDSAFYTGSFQVATRLDGEQMHFKTEVSAMPSEERVMIVHTLPQERNPDANMLAFLNVLSRVIHNSTLTHATRNLVQALRSNDERRVGRHAKRLYQLIADELPKP